MNDRGICSDTKILMANNEIKNAWNISKDDQTILGTITNIEKYSAKNLDIVFIQPNGCPGYTVASKHPILTFDHNEKREKFVDSTNIQDQTILVCAINDRREPIDIEERLASFIGLLIATSAKRKSVYFKFRCPSFACNSIDNIISESKTNQWKSYKVHSIDRSNSRQYSFTEYSIKVSSNDMNVIKSVLTKGKIHPSLWWASKSFQKKLIMGFIASCESDSFSFINSISNLTTAINILHMSWYSGLILGLRITEIGNLFYMANDYMKMIDGKMYYHIDNIYKIRNENKYVYTFEIEGNLIPTIGGIIAGR